MSVKKMFQHIYPSTLISILTFGTEVANNTIDAIIQKKHTVMLT